MRFAHTRRQLQATEHPTLGQRGAVMVEFAFVALLIFTMLGGAYDFGMSWRLGIATNEAARTGARVGSGMGNDPLADWYALSGAKAALTSAGKINDVQRVVIYKSTTVDGVVPSTCTTGTTTTAVCNVLTGAQFRALTQSNINTTTGCIITGYATVMNWCPNTRSGIQLSADYFGIWIQVKYTNAFKVIGTSRNIERDAVMRLEPDDT